jgi:hypothetical protein
MNVFACYRDEPGNLKHYLTLTYVNVNVSLENKFCFRHQRNGDSCAYNQRYRLKVHALISFKVHHCNSSCQLE